MAEGAPSKQKLKHVGAEQQAAIRDNTVTTEKDAAADHGPP